MKEIEWEPKDFKIGERFKITTPGHEKSKYEVVEVTDEYIKVKDLYNPGYSPMTLPAWQLTQAKIKYTT